MNSYLALFSSVQSLNCVQLFVTPWTAEHLTITNSQSLLNHVSIESVTQFCHFNLCCALLLPPSIFPSIRLFSNESVLCIRWPKYWSFSFSIRLGLELRKPEEPVLEFILEKGHDLEGRVQTISVLSWPLWRPPLPITTTSSGHPLSGKWT